MFEDLMSGVRRARFKGASHAVLAAALGAGVIPTIAIAQEVTVLPTLTLEGQNANTQKSTNTLARMPGSVQDTPQTIQVITKEVLKQQGVATLEQALRVVPGITMGVGEGGGAFNGDQFRIRGFDAKDDVYIDGLRDFGVYTRDSFNYEQVEVLKGPSSSLFGRGTTGGAINTVSKSAKAERFTTLDTAAGNGSYLRGTANVNMPLDDTTALRVNFMAHSQEVVGRDVLEANRWGAAVALGFGIGTGTTADVVYFHQQEDRIPDYGVPTLTPPGQTIARPVTENAGVPRSAFYGFTRDYDNTNADIFTVKLKHGLREGVTLYNDSRIGVYKRDFSATRVACNATDPTPATSCLVTLYDNNPATVPFLVPGAAASGTGPYSMNAWGAQNIFAAVVDLPLGGNRNQFVVGADVSYQSSDRNFFEYSPGVRPNQNVFAPNPNFVYTIVSRTGAANVASSFVSGTDYAFFASDQFWFTEDFSVLVSGRLDTYHVSYDFRTVANVTTTVETGSTLFNPRAAAIFEPSEDQTYYASWARSATPQGTSITSLPTPVAATVSAGGFNTRDLEPEENEIYEIGAKYSLLGGNLGLSAAAFHIKKGNAKQTDGLGNLISSGDKQEVSGIELGVSGAITDQLLVTASYAYLDTETTESTTAGATGKDVPNTPRNAVTLWTTWAPIQPVQLGLGVIYSDGIFLNNTNLTEVPETVSFDALASYTFDKWRVALNVTNLMDEVTYSGSQNGRAIPAPGRTFILSAGISF